jgi:hypothetical protein
LGAPTTTKGTKIPARIPGTTNRMRSTAAIGFLPAAAFLGRGRRCNYGGIEDAFE